MLAKLCKGNPDLSKQFSTLSNKSWPVVVSFKCSSDSHSSVISKFSSNPLINTSSCAVSFIPVLSSSSSEYHSNDIPASNSCSDRFYAIPPIRRTIVLLDREIASILVLTSGHVISTASSKNSFTNYASENGLLCLKCL